MNKGIFTFFLVVVLIFPFSYEVYGNAAEPPSIVIIVPNPPVDLVISIEENGSFVEGRKTKKMKESYYAFYLEDLKNTKNYNIKVVSGNTSFQIEIDNSLKTYNNVFTLNLKDRSLTEGKSLPRTIKLVSLRVMVTLVIEGLIFFLLGFRNKRSWLAFIVINLITQGGLNIWLNGSYPWESYLIFSLFFGELWVFIVEGFAFKAYVKEHHPQRVFAYVVLANFASLVAGGYLITLLPV
ncbi:hypothetical protein [Alkaliphilus serpentinus]|uniref:Uncharacterized protein n=1 Tax=Alkaliphilus serpentinus TaxID=1482731 RepID=A0A833M9H3_9FIRM|nr:hypothetical protein [Alkaliphilus serpentinus]KAB3533525.1 hypothetical protein F8153_00280 [Alkaliphilus serpentinus]